GLVEDVPRVEARVGERLAMPSRRAVDARQRVRGPRQEGLAADEPAAQQEQLLVVARDAFEDPEQARMVAPLEAIRHERRRLRPLHVPRVKVLVAREREEALIRGRDARLADSRQVVAVEHQARRRAMLETAVAAAGRDAKKAISIERRRTAEEIDLRLAELLEIGSDALEIAVEPPR